MDLSFRIFFRAYCVYVGSTGSTRDTGDEAMTRFLCWLIAVGVAVQLFMPSAFAARWEIKSARNEMKVAEYINQLRDGVNPGSLDRPTLRFISNYQAKQRRKVLIQAMEEAETLARAGKHKQIQGLDLKSSIPPAERIRSY
jgi:1,2-phenylacetyl-CoA epoxidase catalytic subunit